MRTSNKSLQLTYIGHRKRLRQKFELCNEAIQDYELLELLLFYIFPRKDTKRLAKALLRKFRTLHKLIFSEKSAILEVDGIGESTYVFIQVLRELYARLSLEKVQRRPLINSIDRVVEYYNLVLSSDIREQLRVMFLDNKSQLIAEEQIQSGTVNRTAFFPREIIKKALDYGASAIIITHNHPSGDPTPSQQDIDMTKNLQKICKSMDIVLLDHIIIGANKVTSFHNKKII